MGAAHEPCAPRPGVVRARRACRPRAYGEERLARLCERGLVDLHDVAIVELLRRGDRRAAVYEDEAVVDGLAGGGERGREEAAAQEHIEPRLELEVERLREALVCADRGAHDPVQLFGGHVVVKVLHDLLHPDHALAHPTLPLDPPPAEPVDPLDHHLTAERRAGNVRERLAVLGLAKLAEDEALARQNRGVAKRATRRERLRERRRHQPPRERRRPPRR